MDQNDIFLEKGQLALRRIYQVEEGQFPNTRIGYISMACLHCQDSPCIVGCPTMAINKDRKTQAILVNRELCIGCHSCALACPFGVPRYDAEEKMQKCNLCAERVEFGLPPACVKVCPFKALLFDSINMIQDNKQFKLVTNLIKNIYAVKSAG
jgi:Fe-S-cluster-containing dehydrogenase component